MISVRVWCTASSATTSWRAELLPAQLAIKVDYRYVELAKCSHMANVDLMQENYVPASPLFLHLAARGTHRGPRRHVCRAGDVNWGPPIGLISPTLLSDRGCLEADSCVG